MRVCEEQGLASLMNLDCEAHRSLRRKEPSCMRTREPTQERRLLFLDLPCAHSCHGLFLQNFTDHDPGLPSSTVPFGGTYRCRGRCWLRCVPTVIAVVRSPASVINPAASQRHRPTPSHG